jgi:hypothetical protein
MFKGKLLSLLVAAAMGILMICPINANADTFTASIDVGGFDIFGFTTWLDVGSDFAFTGGIPSDPYGGAVPGVWFDEGVTLGSVSDSPRLSKFGSSDFGSLFSPFTETPLMDGTLFSFDYTGTINGLYLVQFPDYSAQDLYQSGDIFLASSNFTGENTGAIFNAVPIPSTILLLGGGLAALVGLRRRRRS